MIKKFSILESELLLEIKQSATSHLVGITYEVISFLLILSVFILPYDQLINLHHFAWIVYFLPVIPLVRLLYKLSKFYKGNKITFNKSSNQFLIDNVFFDQLSNLVTLEWNANQNGDNITLSLDLLPKK